MIRNDVYSDIDEWERKEVVLSVVVPGRGIVAERVQITGICGNWVLCLDSAGRNQVYSSQHVLGWEPADSESLAYLEADSPREEPYREPSQEEKGIFNVGSVKKVIQEGSKGRGRR